VSLLSRILTQARNLGPARAAQPSPSASLRADVPEARSRPDAPDGASNYVILVLDSCRFDSFVRAKPRIMSKLGTVEKRWTYATWTAPSHYNLLIGLLPHVSPSNVYASEYYKEDFLRFKDRFNFADMSFGRMVPNLWLPSFLRDQMGYRTNMYVSMPVLNPTTPINHAFDDYALMDHHNDVSHIFRRMRFYAERPSFFVLNTGETHYPYATPDEPENEWPRISGVNGVFKHLDDLMRNGEPVRAKDAPTFFDDDKMKQLHQRQVDAVSWVDRAVEELFDIVPDNTWITITADHGELFGEKGYFGHGPINHEKVIEVPFIEGKLR
jgi:hypothetical protein